MYYLDTVGIVFLLHLVKMVVSLLFPYLNNLTTFKEVPRNVVKNNKQTTDRQTRETEKRKVGDNKCVRPQKTYSSLHSP